MEIKKAAFISSGTASNHFPAPVIPEYAMIGRSNVGKSSLINMLCNNNKLAKVSKTPGKTITINHFLIDDTWYLADMPGYGYARRSKDTRMDWEKMTLQFLTTRENLLCVFVLIDARIPPQKLDIAFINSLGTHGVAFALIFTKCDKLSPKQIKDSINVFSKELLKTWETMPPILKSSAFNKLGKTEILGFIERLNISYKKK